MFDHSVHPGISDSVREDKALAFKLPSTGVSDNANSITNSEQATALAVEGQFLFMFQIALVLVFSSMF